MVFIVVEWVLSEVVFECEKKITRFWPKQTNTDKSKTIMLRRMAMAITVNVSALNGYCKATAQTALIKYRRIALR